MVGQLVELRVTTSVLGTLTDATTLTLVLTDPLGASTTYTLPPGPVVRDDVGTYHFDFTPAVAGVWTFTWSATGGPLPDVPAGSVTVAPLPVPVTVTVQTAGLAPIAGTLVQLYGANGAVYGAGVTGAAGTAKVTVPPGEYQLEVTRKKTVFDAAQMITVTDSDGSPQAFTVVGTPLTIVGPTPPARVRLYGNMVGRDGAPVAQTIIMETLGTGYTKDWVQPETPATGLNPTNTLVKREKWSVLVDGSGYWETDVVVGTRVRVWIPETHFEVVFTVPSTVSILNIADVMADLGFRPQDENPSPKVF